jgi:hypothetical protein
MITFRTLTKWAALATCVFIGISVSQNTPQPRNSRPVTVAERLKQRGVSLTRQGLVLALRSSDPETRFLAAEQLAYEGAKETVPDIRDALRRESSPLAEINISYALAQLEDRDGFKALEEGCSNDKLAPNLRLVAARYLLDLHRNYCISSVLTILQNTNPVDRMQALSLLPKFEQLSDSDVARMLSLVLVALQDPIPAVRISAGDVIAVIGGKSVDEDLRAAMDREGDDVVRSQLQSDLQRLRKKYEEK